MSRWCITIPLVLYSTGCRAVPEAAEHAKSAKVGGKYKGFGGQPIGFDPKKPSDAPPMYIGAEYSGERTLKKQSVY